MHSNVNGLLIYSQFPPRKLQRSTLPRPTLCIKQERKLKRVCGNFWTSLSEARFPSKRNARNARCVRCVWMETGLDEVINTGET